MGLAQSNGARQERQRLRNARCSRRQDPRHPKIHPDPDNAPAAVVQRVDHNPLNLGF